MMSRGRGVPGCDWVVMFSGGGSVGGSSLGLTSSVHLQVRSCAGRGSSCLSLALDPLWVVFRVST